MSLEIGYHASQEQFTPSALCGLVVRAESAGFSAIHSSDHFYPWSGQQGQSGHVYSWLGAAMSQTSIPFSLVTSPGQRYHPAVMAQAIATLGDLYPGRLIPCLGSGEALNEHITGETWPDKEMRNQRLKSCYGVMRGLLDGKPVSGDGGYRMPAVRLYTLPRQRVPLYGAALTERTARWMGSWAESLITVQQPIGDLLRLIHAFREGGGVGKPLILKMQLAYGANEEAALAGAMDQWRNNVLSPLLLSELASIEQFDAVGRFVTADAIREHVFISADWRAHSDHIARYAELGFARIILHNVTREQELFIDDFGERLLPEFKR